MLEIEKSHAGKVGSEREKRMKDKIINYRQINRLIKVKNREIARGHKEIACGK